MVIQQYVTVGPLCNLGSVPFIGGVPGLGQPATIKYVGTVAVEYPDGLALAAAGPGVSGAFAFGTSPGAGIGSGAAKFSQAASTVTISFEEKEDLVEVRVTDHGIGIPQQSQNMLFQRFQQIQSEDPRHKGGTGLGLAICKQIIEQNGGTIGVRNKEAEGSTFWFTIPTAASTNAN